MAPDKRYVPPIGELTAFESAVLAEIGARLGDDGALFLEQVRHVRVIDRENTVVGFYTQLKIDKSACRALPIKDGHFADGHFQVEQLEVGVGIELYAQDGFLTTIEGWTVGDDELTDTMIANLKLVGRS
jgi:hypothetical protein